MSAIDIRNFVDVNIVRQEVSTVNSIRDTAVLFTTEGTPNTSGTYSSYAELDAALTGTFTNTKAYAKVFFDNNGQKLYVVQGITDSQTALETAVKALADKYIVAAFTGTAAHVKTTAKNLASDTAMHGIKKKILVMRTNTDDEESVKNLAVKYSSQSGAEMTIAAYLTSIDVYGTNTVQDYDYTEENVLTANLISDQETLSKVITHNMNCDINLAGAIRNIGGNLKDGSDLVNEFVLIVLQQTVTDRVLLALSTKLKGEAGLSVIRTAITEELNKYVVNGYLTTDEIWTDNDYTVDYNARTYTIITRNTALLAGYVIKILPYEALSAEDRQNRKTPPIYLILADQYGIRKVEIGGKVI